MTAENYFQTVVAYTFYYHDDQRFWKDNVLVSRDELLVKYKNGMVELLSNHLQKTYTKQAVDAFLTMAETCAFIPAEGRSPTTVTVKALPLWQGEGNQWSSLKDTVKYVYLTKAKNKTARNPIEQWSFETLRHHQLKHGIYMEIDNVLLHILRLYRAVVNMITGLDLYMYAKGNVTQ